MQTMHDAARTTQEMDKTERHRVFCGMLCGILHVLKCGQMCVSNNGYPRPRTRDVPCGRPLYVLLGGALLPAMDGDGVVIDMLTLSMFLPTLEMWTYGVHVLLQPRNASGLHMSGE